MSSKKENVEKKKSVFQNRNFIRLLILVAELIFGIFLLVDPNRFAAALIVITAVIFAAFGVYKMIHYFKTPVRQAITEHDFLNGSLYLFIAVILLLCLNPTISFFRLLSTVFGLVIAYLGLLKLQEGINLFRRSVVYWYLTALSGALTVGFGIIALVNPFKSIDVTWVYVATTLIILAALDAVSLFLTLVYTKKLEQGYNIAAAKEQRHQRALEKAKAAEEKRKQREEQEAREAQAAAEAEKTEDKAADVDSMAKPEDPFGAGNDSGAASPDAESAEASAAGNSDSAADSEPSSEEGNAGSENSGTAD